MEELLLFNLHLSANMYITLVVINSRLCDIRRGSDSYRGPLYSAGLHDHIPVIRGLFSEQWVSSMDWYLESQLTKVQESLSCTYQCVVFVTVSVSSQSLF